MRSAGSPSKRKWNGNCPDKLVETVGEHEAAAESEGRAEGGLLGGGLGASVDHASADGRVVGPGGNQAPSEQGEPASPLAWSSRTTAMGWVGAML